MHPLWYATYHQRQDLVELFLQYRADVNMAAKVRPILHNFKKPVLKVYAWSVYVLFCIVSQDDFGETALIAAIGRGNLHIVAILVKNGANVNYRTKVRGSTDHYFL